jgi:hypothetical protein
MREYFDDLRLGGEDTGVCGAGVRTDLVGGDDAEGQLGGCVLGLCIY